MSAKKISNRKRSRPIEKHSKLKGFKKNKYALVGIIIIVVCIAVGGTYILLNQDTSNENEQVQQPVAVFDTTLGEFKIKLYEDEMPITCANFINLVNDGFYDGMNFYRVMEGFMIQAGRYYPDGSEKQSPYGTIQFEESNVKHIDGAISMARGTSMDSASAEFFICDGAQTGLDGSYAAFGVTIEGLDVIHSIAEQPNDGAHPAGGGKPYTDIVINSIKIEYQ